MTNRARRFRAKHFKSNLSPSQTLTNGGKVGTNLSASLSSLMKREKGEHR